MHAAIALAVQIMAAIPSITTSVQNLLNWVASVRDAARQTGEWTDVHEAAFINALLNRRDTKPYKTDAELGLTPLPLPAISAPCTGKECQA